MKNKEIFKITLSAIFLALAFVLPFLTGQIPEIGSMLCPMHIPVILCGFICGWKYGLIVGVIAPLLRSLTIGMPSLFPTAICMSFELAAYGFISGILYNLLPKKKLYIYITLIVAMIGGRVVWGTAMFCFLGFNNNKFGLSSFWTGGFVNAFPGIVLQIVLIPIIIMVWKKYISKDKEIN